jgi:hypothetical protein
MQVGLMSDPQVIAETCAEMCAALGEAHGILVCNACGNIEAPIAGLLVSNEHEEAWALCGECLRAVPLLGAVT